MTSFAENPTALEAPLNVTVRQYDVDTLMLRWTVPESIVNYYENEELDGELFYCIDWKMNEGPWHFDTPKVNQQTYASDTEAYFHGYTFNITWDEEKAQEVFFVPWHFNPDNEVIDLANNTYSFRMRFALLDYSKGDEQDYITSPYSVVASIGKNAQGGVAPKTLEAPTNLKVETRKGLDGEPYFYLGWNNPASVDAADKNVPIEFKVDFKVGNGRWYSEENGHDWWGAYDYATHIDFDPVEKEYADKIVIEENTYYFRILYAYEPLVGNPVYSPFSNVFSIGIQAHEWAKGELQGAFEAGLVPDILKGADLTKNITREEFCELAVLLYEKVTETEAQPAAPNPFIDTNNPQILKAFALEITKGKDKPNTFKPLVLINRQECATALFRAIQKINPDDDYSIDGVKDFPDQKDISSWAVQATKYMSKLGIVKGDAKTGYFMPRAITTVQEAEGYGMATREHAILMSIRTFNTLK